MDLKKTLKSVALAGMTFAAGFGAYHLTHQKPTPSKAPTNEKMTIAQKDAPKDSSHDSVKAPVASKGSLSQRRVVNYQKTTYDTYEVHAGVLMPFAGESQDDYEARRLRLETEENLLKQKLAENISRQLEEARAKKMSSRWIDALEDRLEEHEKKATYFSYYTSEGQARLKVYNENQARNVSAGVRSGRTYDF